MTCRRSSHQASTEELEKRPSRQRQRQPTTTRTINAHMQTLGPDLLLGKSNRNRDTIIEAIAKSLSSTTPASGHDRSSITTHAITTNRSKQGLRNPSLEWITQKLFCCRSPDPVCASRPAKNILPWCHRKTPPLAQETGARARYLPRCSPAKRVLHPMCIM